MADWPRRGSRRRFLAALSAVGLAGAAGCTGGDDGSSDGGGSTIQDSDGDGMIDSEDYAPRDPDVQERSDLDGGDGGGTPGGSDGGGSGGSDSDGSGSGGGSGDGEGSGGGGGDVTYPSHSGTHEITARENYWAWEFGVDAEFVLEYTATNLLDENYDFDVLLYDRSAFEEYRAIANEVEEGVRPEYLDGSAPGVTAGVEGTARLPAGTYYLVVDNTDLSDAGDWGTEETRRVQVEAETRPA